MNGSRVVGIAAVVTLAAGVGFVALEGEETASIKPERVIPKAEVESESTVESKVAWLEDGGKSYRVPVKLKDGGRDVDERGKDEAPCKRLPKGGDGNRCRHNGQPAPELNRYPADEMTGPDCEGVACSVWLGEDASKDEVEP